MDQQLIKLFTTNNLEFTDNYFADAKIIKSEYSTSESFFRVIIEINDFLPTDVLLKLETTLLANATLPTKVSFRVRNENYQLETIFSYLEYIRFNKSELKNSFFSKLPPSRFTLADNILKIIVHSDSEKKLVSEHYHYYENKLCRYGFNNLRLDLIVDLQENNILELNEQELIKYQENQQKNESLTLKPAISTKQLRNGTSNYVKGKIGQVSYERITDIDQDAPNITIYGKIVNKDRQFISTKKFIYTITVTDYSDTIAGKFFTRTEQADDFFEELKIDEWVSIFGDIRYDTYANEQMLFIKKIARLDREDLYREDNAAEKRVELHLHTKMSTMDGVIDLPALFKTLQHWDHSAIAFTDHLNVQAYPEIYNLNKKYPNIKVIYGVEADVLDDKVWYVKNPHHYDLRTAKYVIFDLETTGLSSSYDEIIEFGAVIMDGISGERKIINHLFKPTIKLSSFITELTGITDELLADKPTFTESIDQILEYFKDAILIAHNAEFDLGFIQSWLEKAGRSKINNTVIDTLQISRILEPHLKNYRLGTIALCYNVIYNEEVAHRGDYDAIVLTDVYEHQLRKMINVYGVEFDDDIDQIHDAAVYKKLRPKHMTILTKNQLGLLDLFKLITAAHTTYFYSSPKLLRSVINEHRANLLIGSSCVNGDVFEVARNKDLSELTEVISFYDYIEIQPPSVYKHLVQMGDLSEERLLTVIKDIIYTAKKLNKPVVATGDVHYLNPEDKIFREVYINAKGIGGRPHPLYDYKQRVTDYPDQFLRTTPEMLNEFKFLNDDELIQEIVVTNPSLIANQIEKVEIIKDKLYTPKIDGSDELLEALCYQNAYKIYGNPLPEIVAKRLERELSAIIKHGFAVIYWIAHKLVDKSLQDGYLVGSRGSVGSSFVATMSNITEVNPLQPHYLCSNCTYSEFIVDGSVKCGYDLPPRNCPKCQHPLKGDGHDIPFETFLGFEADKVPDIDLNFSGEYQPNAHDFTKEMFGERNVYRAGTISTVAEKTAYGYVKGYFENKNTLHLKRRAELERIAKGCEGVKRTTGQHPGGIVVIPKEYQVEEFTPVNFPADDIKSNWLTTHFDFHAIHDNVLKLDILGHVDPTALRMLEDLTGIDPKTIPTNDEKVLSLFRSLDVLNIKPDDINGEKTGAIGIPEFGTFFVRKMLLDTKPTSFADLVQISGLSHGTDVWIGNAQDLIRNQNIRISDVIGCRDDIMVNLIYKGLPAQSAFKIMEDVRKGKGLTPEHEQLMRENNVEQWYIDSCNKIKYMFPKAHATAYVLMAWRVAWFKINYPVEYYATFFSTRTDVFDIKTILKGAETIKQVLRDIQVRLDNKDFNAPNKPSQKEKDLIPVYEIALEMYARGIKMSNIDLKTSMNKNFTVVENDNHEKIILPPFSAIDGLGGAVGDSIINARKEKPFLSIADLQKRTNITKVHLESFEELGILKGLSLDDQIAFEF
ncbi:MAG: PolC-type DNA polymerase III [Spiroplasma poulsonii]|uniref:DNA polymerase III PolC-type n=1 Tax=Spiroplasma poulsonii TaxID=2138 RepID=A0A2P6FF95_9MOLU|nr:PolC-type DNA polymerase III [Spiroplasma poulsonii]KAF0850244.1 DNA polymerase III PolC-type [Spiroplasma poulsonii]MBW1241902.1 PolC-type DNA polymerase III [Spiroplasma poulsonii]PQM32129.1 DNA polymerase III PolC-type [Spiroplasma poulsonii]PWF94776.1 DNA polymerase III PolC-type [Spiroplasma poulsonii]PWF97573.1 DNA polymerase III PolC-type [Spiroplasma poulsonii]